MASLLIDHLKNLADKEHSRKEPEPLLRLSRVNGESQQKENENEKGKDR